MVFCHAVNAVSYYDFVTMISDFTGPDKHFDKALLRKKTQRLIDDVQRIGIAPQ